MKDILKRLFGAHHLAADATIKSRIDSPASGTPGNGLVSLSGQDEAIFQNYFALSMEIEQAKADRDYVRAIKAARATYPMLRAVVDAWVHEYGSFTIVTSHAVHTGGTLMAVMGDREGIEELRAVLATIPELASWRPVADAAMKDLGLVGSILEAVRAAPGLMQTELKSLTGSQDGRRTSALVSWLEKGNRVRRVRKGSSYQIYPSDSAQTKLALPVQEPAPQGPLEGNPSGTSPTIALAPRIRRQRPANQAQTINLEALPYVRLPMAPPRWDEAGRAQPHSVAPSRFVVEGEGWHVNQEEKLGPAERPDPAYKDVLPTSGATYWLDTKGRREGFPESPTVVRVTDRNGTLLVERGIPLDVYRHDVNTTGSGILFLSREGHSPWVHASAKPHRV